MPYSDPARQRLAVNAAKKRYRARRKGVATTDRTPTRRVPRNALETAELLLEKLAEVAASPLEASHELHSLGLALNQLQKAKREAEDPITAGADDRVRALLGTL